MDEQMRGWWESLTAALTVPGPTRTAVLTVGVAAAAGLLVWAVWAAFSALMKPLRRWNASDLRLGSWRFASSAQISRGAIRVVASLRWLAAVALLCAAAWASVALTIPSVAALAGTLSLGVWAAQATLWLWWMVFRTVKALGATVLLAISTQEQALKPWKVGEVTLLSAAMLEKGLVALLRVLGWAVLGLATAMTITLVLGYFSYTWSWQQSLVHLLAAVVEPVVGAVTSYLPSLGTGLLVIGAAWVILRVLKIFFREWQAGNGASHDAERAQTTYKLLRLGVIILAGVMVFPYVPGSDSEAFRSVAIFLGVLISLGSSSFVGNVMAGISLTYMAPFQAGDWVKIGAVSGEVIERTLLVTRVKTIKNELVTLPNAVVVSREVENFSASAPIGPVLLHLEVTFAFEVPWRTVHEVLLRACAAVPGLLTVPAPFVLQRGFGDFFVRYELNAAIDEPRRMVDIESDLRAAVQDGFHSAGIAMLTPSQHVVRTF